MKLKIAIRKCDCCEGLFMVIENPTKKSIEIEGVNYVDESLNGSMTLDAHESVTIPIKKGHE